MVKGRERRGGARAARENRREVGEAPGAGGAAGGGAGEGGGRGGAGSWRLENRGWMGRVTKRKARICRGLFMQHRELEVVYLLVEIYSKIFLCPSSCVCVCVRFSSKGVTYFKFLVIFIKIES